MKRLFLLITLLLGLFLSFSASFLSVASNTHPDPNLAWFYYDTSTSSYHAAPIYRTQPELGITQEITSKLPRNAKFHRNVSTSTWLIFDQRTLSHINQGIYRVSWDGKTVEKLLPATQQEDEIIRRSGDWLIIMRRLPNTREIYRLHLINKTWQYLTTIPKTEYFSFYHADWFCWGVYIDDTRVDWYGFHIPSGQTFTLYSTAPYTYMNGLMFAADGKSFYFNAPSATNSHIDAIYRFNLSDGESQALTLPPSASQIFLRESPDGQWIYYRQGETLYRLAKDGNSPPTAFFHLLGQTYLEFSPDGKWLVFHALESTASYQELYLMDANTPSPTRIHTSNQYFLSSDSCCIGIYDYRNIIVITPDGNSRHYTPLVPQPDDHWQVAGHWLLYSQDGEFYRFNLRTGFQAKILFNNVVWDFFIDARSIPTPPTPTNALVAGFAMLSTSLIFAYKFQRRGLIKLA